jgi:hypothetical protein
MFYVKVSLFMKASKFNTKQDTQRNRRIIKLYISSIRAIHHKTRYSTKRDSYRRKHPYNAII